MLKEPTSNKSKFIFFWTYLHEKMQKTNFFEEITSSEEEIDLEEVQILEEFERKRKNKGYCYSICGRLLFLDSEGNNTFN